MNIRQRNDPGRWTAILQGKCRKQGWKNSGFAVHLRGSFLCLSMLECFKVTNSWLCSSQQSNRWNRTDPNNAWSCQSAGTPQAATIVLWLECVSVEFRPFPSTNPPNADCSPSMWTSYDRRRTFDRFLSDNCLRAVLQLIMLDDCLPIVGRRSGRRIRWIGPLNTTRKYLLVESWLKSSRTDAQSRLGREGHLNVAFPLWFGIRNTMCRTTANFPIAIILFNNFRWDCSRVILWQWGIYCFVFLESNHYWHVQFPVGSCIWEGNWNFLLSGKRFFACFNHHRGKLVATVQNYFVKTFWSRWKQSLAML